MSGRKNTLLKYQTLTSGSMAGNLTSAVTNIQFLDNICMQMNWTTADAVGTFNVQGSADYAQDDYGNVTTTGNWVSIPALATAAGGASGNALLDMQQLSFPWIRVTYTRTSGSGTANIFISGKQI